MAAPGPFRVCSCCSMGHPSGSSCLSGWKDAMFLPRRPRGASGECDRVCSEPGGWSQIWVTSQTGTTTTCPVCWDQVSFFLVKPSGALGLLAAPRLSFVLQFQEAKERGDTKGRMPRLPTRSLHSGTGSWAQGGSQGSTGETCAVTARPSQELRWGLEGASLSTTLGLSNLYFC